MGSEVEWDRRRGEEEGLESMSKGVGVWLGVRGDEYWCGGEG